MKVKITIIILLIHNLNQINTTSNEDEEDLKKIDKSFGSIETLSNNHLYSLDSWLDNDDNSKKLIYMILITNFKNSIECDLSLIISNIYQLLLLKKTLFSKDALKILLDGCSNTLIADLKNIENSLIHNFLPFLTSFENKINQLFKKAPNDKEILSLIKYLLSYNNIFNRLQMELRNYIVNCRANISENEIYNIPFKSKNIKIILAKYNVFISSMIEVYCRTMMIFKCEMFLKAIDYCKKSENDEMKDYKKFINKIDNFINDLKGLTHLVYYNIDKYNKLINHKIIKIKELFGDQISPITADRLTNFCKKILLNTNIIEKFEEKQKLSSFLYYLSNSNGKDRISFKKTKNNMLACCKEIFPELKILNVNLKNFRSYQSVINHIKIKIEATLILKKDEKSKLPVIFCSYKLIPTIIQDNIFNNVFSEMLQNACNQIRNAQKDIIIKYEKNLELDKTNEENKKWKYFTIIEEKKNYIFKNVISRKNIKEYFTMGIDCLEYSDPLGNSSIKKIDLDVRTIFYRFLALNEYDDSFISRSKQFTLYPIRESIQKSADQNSDLKFYYFEGYIYNPKIAELKKKSYILTDIIFSTFNNLNYTELMMTTSNFTTDWFETNILYGNLWNDFFNVVPYKYVSSWMTYLTFRSILKNKFFINGEAIKPSKNNVECIYSIITRYEISNMGSDPFYNINHIDREPFIFLKNDTNKKLLYWSDKKNIENQKLELKKINNIRPGKKKFNLLFYEFDITLNQQRIGDNDISVIRLDTYVTKIEKIPILWNMIHWQYRVACNADRKNKNLEQLRNLIKNL